MAPAPAVHIIDDDDAVRDSLAMLLEAHDVPVATYASAPAFLDALAAGLKGCVITDIQMPRMNGMELLSALKAGGHRLPVIVVTARTGRAMAAEAMVQGAAALIEKPFAPEKLLDLIRSALAPAP